MARRNRVGGFTLVELLVVIGIIALLISILLPALNRARESGRIVKCMSNIRQVNLALQQYLNENRGFIPDAEYGNSYGPLSPASFGLPAYTRFNPSTFPNQAPYTTYVLPTIGQVLSRYMSAGEQNWKCPAGESSESGGRDEPYQGVSNPAAGPDAGDVYGGWDAAVLWRPNYFYMCTKGYGQWTSPASIPDTGDPTGWRGGDWTVRNIAGLNAARIRSITGQKSSEIVTFLEYKSYFHSGGQQDVYAVQAPSRGKYKANYAYLDGHAETREYRNLDEYINNLHQPIPQSWGGVRWQGAFAGLYRPYAQRYPDTIP
jgi:prepilin-type N-terminal cleavage/methylation domain-containing protein/prepilin-type processing-associated H-X9-DG protein